jgi:hypothetical protein
MNTVDGKAAIPGKYYYLENGEEVCLDNVVRDSNGVAFYLVTPFYEGEAMAVSGDGGFHREIACPYEFEAEQRLVKAIFSVAPVAKIDEQIKKRTDDLNALGLAYGKVLDLKEKAQSELRRAEQLVKEFIASNKKTCEEKELLASSLEELQEKVNEKRQELSVLEDSVSTSTIDSEGYAGVETKELARLRARDFELQCLEAGGVDNWDWYSESLKEYCKRYPSG